MFNLKSDEFGNSFSWGNGKGEFSNGKGVGYGGYYGNIHGNGDGDGNGDKYGDGCSYSYVLQILHMAHRRINDNRNVRGDARGDGGEYDD